ncbi:DUF3307 domain-containing protein [Vibrio sp. H11]|uniref:DUF3307 domain-containing protein n=1 Tax=Vibrio sp. H11 TaxID=2565928 RepID=UPI0010A6A4DD|nr:DUF3307 domain-containing protein [Vibrio sp. H11]
MADFFTAWVPFLLAHILCEFYLLPKRCIAAKRERGYRSAALYWHALLHGLVLIIPAMAHSSDWSLVLSLAALTTFSHVVIGWIRFTPRHGDKFGYFVFDQMWHAALLAAMAFYMTDSVTLQAIVRHEQFADGVMVLFAYLLILKPTSVLIGLILSKYPIVVSDEEEGNVSGLVAGGELIGYLERLLILTFTLLGSYAAVGFVLAAKSIFRFGELNKSADRSMAEYVLIGSLVSVVITTLVGTLVSLGLDVKIK